MFTPLANPLLSVPLMTAMLTQQQQQQQQLAAQNTDNKVDNKDSKVLPKRYKTRMCRNFVTTGVCHFQSRCIFAHSADELRTTDANEASGITTTEALRDVQMTSMLKNRDQEQVRPVLPPVPPPLWKTLGASLPLFPAVGDALSLAAAASTPMLSTAALTPLGSPCGTPHALQSLGGVADTLSLDHTRSTLADDSVHSTPRAADVTNPTPAEPETPRVVRTYRHDPYSTENAYVYLHGEPAAKDHDDNE